MKLISIVPMVGAALVIASSATAPAKEADLNSSEKLAKALNGRTAGPPVNCIRNIQGTSRMEVIDDDTILFREGGTVYLQRPQGGCNRLGGGGMALITRQVGSTRLCSGDISQLVDPTNGIGGGSCVMGPFVPYNKPS